MSLGESPVPPVGQDIIPVQVLIQYRENRLFFIRDHGLNDIDPGQPLQQDFFDARPGQIGVFSFGRPIGYGNHRYFEH